MGKKHKGGTMSLTVNTSKMAKGVFVITPVGSINTDTYGVLEKETQKVLKKGPQKIILDMVGVEYISSMGLRVVLSTLKALKNENGELALVNLQPQIQKVFDIVNAMPSMRIFESMEEMDRYLDTMQKKALAGEDEE
jgi:anti-anti-sigma factor